MKNRIRMSLLIILALVLIVPFNSYAKESNEELLKCTYSYEGNELEYVITDSGVSFPFENGEKINSKFFYNSQSLLDGYFNSSKTSDGKITCPTVTVEDTEWFTTITLDAKNEKSCNGKCMELIAKSDVLTNRVETVDVLWTKVGTAIGKYESTAYFIPYFRKLSDGVWEWSIDGNHFYNFKESIKLDDKNIVSLDVDLEEKVFTKEESFVNIYRCISNADGVYQYHLSIDEVYCENKALSNYDNQGLGSLSYNGTLGADGEETNEKSSSGKCQSKILGSPNNENSVAWLLQKLLGYLRILGPMIVVVMSAIDFTRVIVSGDDEVLQKTYKKLINRLILVIALFFVPTLVLVLLETFGFMGDPICVIDGNITSTK